LIPPPQGMSESDFDAIEAAVMETERGRWFLAEFARRRRAEDTARILAAVDRLEAGKSEVNVAEARARLDAERAAGLMRELAELIKELRPVRDARARTSALAVIASSRPPATAVEPARDLESRLAKLVHLDALDVEEKLNLFG